jgi:DNA adenine methylase
MRKQMTTEEGAVGDNFMDLAYKTRLLVIHPSPRKPLYADPRTSWGIFRAVASFSSLYPFSNKSSLCFIFWEIPALPEEQKTGRNPASLTLGRRWNAFRVAPNSTRTLDLRVIRLSATQPSGLDPNTKGGSMRTPISYYGGKQSLAAIILGLIPEHRIYCEPFLGGAAVFFTKPPSKVEVVNDTNSELINFYEVVKQDFISLEKEIAISLHSRNKHRQAEVIYANPDMFDRVKRAWAVWMLANSSYGCALNGGFGYDRTGTTSKKLKNKREAFTEAYAIRLQQTQIECCDALRVIRGRDVSDAFFYIDPPYVGADQGHYDGYSQEDFDNLLKLLETIQGKFLLSSFKNTSLNEFIKRNGWHTTAIKMACSMTSHAVQPREKVEVLTANYPITVQLDERSKKRLVNGAEAIED